MLTLCAVNEIKLLAFYSLFVVAFLAGPATGLTLTWSHDRVQKLRGLVIGLAVGALAVVALTHMVDTGGAVPVPGEPNRITFTCGPDLSGNATLGWTMLYAVKVAAIILTTKFATTSLLSLTSMAVRSAMRLKSDLRQRKARRG